MKRSLITIIVCAAILFGGCDIKFASDKMPDVSFSDSNIETTTATEQYTSENTEKAVEATEIKTESVTEKSQHNNEDNDKSDKQDTQPTQKPTQQNKPNTEDKIQYEPEPTEEVTQKATQKPTQEPTPKPTQKTTQKPTEKPKPKPTEKPVPKSTQAPEPSIDKNTVINRGIAYGKAKGMTYDSSLNTGNSSWFPPSDLNDFPTTSELTQVCYEKIDYLLLAWGEQGYKAKDFAFNVIISGRDLYLVYG